MLKKGDKVVMHSSGISHSYSGKVWVCRSDEWAHPHGGRAILLEGYSGGVSVEGLALVDCSCGGDEDEPNHQRDKTRVI